MLAEVRRGGRRWIPIKKLDELATGQEWEEDDICEALEEWEELGVIAIDEEGSAVLPMDAIMQML